MIAKPKGRPNGIALSPNGRILYVSNSDERNVRAYDLDDNGAASNERVLISGIDGVPDGICVDEKGNLYRGRQQDSRSIRRKAKMLGSIDTTETPSNCTFGDAGFSNVVHHGARRPCIACAECERAVSSTNDESRRYPTRPFLGVGALIFEDGQNSSGGARPRSR